MDLSMYILCAYMHSYSTGTDVKHVINLKSQNQFQITAHKSEVHFFPTNKEVKQPWEQN